MEAQRLGRRSIGFDLNPVAALVTQAKTIPISAGRVNRLIGEITGDARDRLVSPLLLLRDCDPPRSIPASVQKEKWYTRRVLGDLAILWRLLGTYKKHKRLIAEAAFSAILLPVCRETRHWGYVCDNTRPIDSHGGDVFETFASTLHRLAEAYKQRDEDREDQFSHVGRIEPARIECGDAIALTAALSPESIDLVITSPPYEGVCDYVKSQRLSMEWFGYPIAPLRVQEIGARSRRHGADAHAQYVRDMQTVFENLRTSLRPGGFAAVVIGQSAKRKATVRPVTRGAEAAGFEVAVDMNRTVTSQRRQAPSIKDEHILLLRRL